MSIQLATYEKTATALKDYAIDWSAYLEPGEKISSVAYNVAPAGLAVGVGAYADTIDTDGKGCVVWLGGGVVGTSYTVTCHVTTDNVPPRIDDRDIIINVTAPAAILPPGILGEDGSIYSNTGLDWEQKRFAIIPDIDPDGIVDATTVLRGKFATCRKGAWIYVPEPNTAYRVGTGFGANTLFDIDRGVTLSGPERGHKMSSKVFAGAVSGALFNHYGTGKFARLHQEVTACNLEVYYPNQAVAGVSLAVPIPCDWTFEALGLGVSLYNISCANPYWFVRWQTNGGYVDKLWSFPLARGLWLGRVADASRFNAVHFNPGAWASEVTTTTMGFVQDNCVAFAVDGVEEAKFSQCFAFGVATGLLVQDFDADGVLSAFDLNGFGIDQAHACIFVASGLSQPGMRITNASLIPTSPLYPVGTPTAGNGIVLATTAVPASYFQRPTIYGANVIVRGAPGIGRAVWITNTCEGTVSIVNGSFSDTAAAEYCLADNANAVLNLDRIQMPVGVPRTAGAGVITDTNHNFGPLFS